MQLITHYTLLDLSAFVRSILLMSALQIALTQYCGNNPNQRGQLLLLFTQVFTQVSIKGPGGPVAAHEP